MPSVGAGINTEEKGKEGKGKTQCFYTVGVL
jgi:hypothetical protein